MTQSGNIAFGSSFARTEALRKMFYDINCNYGNAKSNRRLFNAIESLLNDGKDDIIEITGKRFGKDVTLKVNGKVEDSFTLWDQDFPALGSSVHALITSFATKRNKHLNLSKPLEFENKILEARKGKVKDYCMKKEASLEDIATFAHDQNHLADCDISLGLSTKLDKIAKSIFGKDRYIKGFKNY